MPIVARFDLAPERSRVASDDYYFSRIPKTGEEVVVVMRDILFDTLLDACVPRANGWSPLLCQHHVYWEWDERPWLVPDIADLVAELDLLSEDVILKQPFGSDALSVRGPLLEFLRAAVAAGDNITIEKR